MDCGLTWDLLYLNYSSSNCRRYNVFSSALNVDIFDTHKNIWINPVVRKHVYDDDSSNLYLFYIATYAMIFYITLGTWWTKAGTTWTPTSLSNNSANFSVGNLS